SKDTVTVTTALGTFEGEVTDGHWSERDPVVLIARLETVRVTDDGETGPNHRRAIVRARMFAGSTTEYLVELDGGHTLRLAVEGHRLPMTEEEEITVLLAPGSLQIVPQEDEQCCGPRPNTRSPEDLCRGCASSICHASSQVPSPACTWRTWEPTSSRSSVPTAVTKCVVMDPGDGMVTAVPSLRSTGTNAVSYST